MNTPTIDPIPVVQLADLALDSNSANCIRDGFKAGPRVFVIIGRWKQSHRKPEPLAVWSRQPTEDRARLAFSNWDSQLNEARLVEVANPNPTPQQTSPDELIVY